MTLKTPIINIMTKAAYKAGNILIKDFREVENLQVSKKGIGDFVTSADLSSEKTIIKILQKGYPEIKPPIFVCLGFDSSLKKMAKIIGFLE